MRLITFLESVESDRQMVEFAREVADGIVQYLKDHNQLQNHGMEAKATPEPFLVQYVYKMLQGVGWSQDETKPFYNLILQLKPTGTGEEWEDYQARGGYGSAGPHHRAIVIHVLLPDNPWKFVDTRLGGMKQTLIHEIVHHLDWLRHKDPGASKKDKEKRKGSLLGGKPIDYFSDPGEYNAYFNEVLEDLDVTFNRVLNQVISVNPDAAKNLVQMSLGNSFPEFVQNTIKSALPGDFVLHPKYRKKFVRRLYKHYVEIVAAMREKGLMEQFRDETTIPNVDDILDDPEYFRRAKKKTARRVQMSPREYIERAIKGFQLHYEGKSFEEVKRLVLGGRSKSKAEGYAKAMQAGDKFPALSLDYTRGFSQEGLHRAIAAMMLGLETVPVVIVEPV